MSETIKKVKNIFSAPKDAAIKKNNIQSNSFINKIDDYLDTITENIENTKETLIEDMTNGDLNIPYITEANMSKIELEVKESKIDVLKYGIDLSNIDKLPYYLSIVETSRSYLSLEEKISLASQMMIIDKQNGYQLLYSTPILKNGSIKIKLNEKNEQSKYNGDYLEFYNPYGVPTIAPLCEYVYCDATTEGWNIMDKQEYESYARGLSKYYIDIMKKSDTYSKHFKKQVYDHLDKLVFLNTNYNHDWAAYSNFQTDVNSMVAIDTNELLEKDDTTGMYIERDNTFWDFMIDTYTHELGHVFANASSKESRNGTRTSDIDYSKDWEKIFEYVKLQEKEHATIRDYAFESPAEFFAECVAEYYGDENSSSIYNTNDLKIIQIEFMGKKISLYDCMSLILGDFSSYEPGELEKIMLGDDNKWDQKD